MSGGGYWIKSEGQGSSSDRGVLHEASQSVFHEACQPFLHEASQLCTMVVNILHENCQRSLARWLSRNGVWHDGCQKVVVFLLCCQ